MMAGSTDIARSLRSQRPLVRVTVVPVVLLDAVALMAYLLLLVGAEIAVTTVNPVLVFPLHGGLVALGAAYLLVCQRLGLSAAEARIRVAAVIALSLAPLIRIISLALPLAELEPVYRYVAAGVPMAIAALLAARACGFKSRQIGLAWRNANWQIAVILLSIALGFVEYVILRPSPMGPPPWTVAGAWPALAIAVFTGFPEELTFRGVIQTALRPVLGRWNWIYVSAIFAVLHIGHLSYVDLVFVFAVGLLYGLVFEQTRSIIGVSVGHGVANVVLFFVAPYLIGPTALSGTGSPSDLAAGMAFALTLMTATAVAIRKGRANGPQIGADGASKVGPIRFTVIADPAASSLDTAALIVPAERETVPITSRVTASATWIEHRTPVARGIVRFCSGNASEGVLIPAGTVVDSIEGQRFRTAKQAFLRRAPMGGIAATDVLVEAEAPGGAGDVGVGSIRWVPFDLGLKGVSVRNETAITGGSRPVVRRIGASDYNDARIAAALRAQQEVASIVAARHAAVGQDDDSLPAAVTISTRSVDPKAGDAIGREADSITLTMQRIATTSSVDIGALRKLAKDQLGASVRAGYRLEPDSITASVIGTEVRRDRVTCTLEVTGWQRPASDAADAKDYRAA